MEYFCTHYESIYNFSVIKNQVQNEELERLSKLFDRVVWFSPFVEDFKLYPHYASECEIRNLIAKLF